MTPVAVSPLKHAALYASLVNAEALVYKEFEVKIIYTACRSKNLTLTSVRLVLRNLLIRNSDMIL